MAIEVRRTPMYRLLHGAPMLAGVPAHYVLILMGIGTVCGLGSMSFDKTVGLVVVGLVILAWVGLAFVHGQDRARVPLMVLKALYRFPRRITSYSPDWPVVRVEE